MDHNIQQQPIQNVPPPISSPPPPSRGWVKWAVLIIFTAAISSAGTYLILQSQKQTPSPTEVSTKAGPTPTPDLYREPTGSAATANWKTYTNTKYKFSMRYPASLISEEQTSDTFLLNVFFKNPKETLYPLRDDFSVEIRNQSKLEEEISYRRWQLSHSIVNDIKETKITKDGFEGARLDYNFTSADQVYLKTIIIIRGRYMYTIEGETSLTNQILSTFKFLN